MYTSTNQPLFAKGFLDKQDGSHGLVYESNKKRIIVRNHLIFCDTRDCVGEQSLLDTQIVSLGNGTRADYAASIQNTTGVSPIKVTLTTAINSITDLKDGDTVTISGVQGNKSANGDWKINAVTPGPPGTFELVGSLASGTYAGGGMVFRKQDPGWPTLTDTTSFIKGNTMTIQLNKKLKVLRSLTIEHCILPRDIIPLIVYLPDFVEFAVFSDSDTPVCSSVRVATTGPGTLATDFEDGDIVDGISLNTNDRILIKDQAILSENGVYIVQAAGAPLRSHDMSTGVSATVVLGNYFVVNTGTINASTTWIVTSATGAVGVGDITFSLVPSGIPISWVSYIPQEASEIVNESIGFYSTPIELWRTYINGSFSMPNQVTPPPYKLWNPPFGGSTHQPQPYPYQSVPTYFSDTFTIPGRIGEFYLVLSGYGLYDLNDWTYLEDPEISVNIIFTTIARTLLFLVIATTQTLRGADTVELVVNSVVVSSMDPLDYFGYGDYQRFVPGPGLQMNYQPGTSDGADPTVARADSPLPFPEFRGNVWGPYNSPGDRFQKLGLRNTLQDLFLNGDLRNLLGKPPLKPWLTAECMALDPTFGIYFSWFTNITMGDLENITNYNILNAMRLVPNGYGAMDVQGLGDGDTLTHIFLNAGGLGPDTNGLPVNGYSTTGGGGAWVNNEVLDPAGTGNFSDPLGVGPLNAPDAGGPNMTVEFSDTTYVGDDGVNKINERVAWYDLGPNNGQFVAQMTKYRDWAITELPDTNVIINAFQAERFRSVQYTNEMQLGALFSCPIRLNLGSTSGTQEYVENVQAFLAQSGLYWEKRFLPPLQSLYKLTLTFTTFEGKEIPLEKMLQPRRSLILLQTLQRALGTGVFDLISPQITRDRPISYLFDTLDPRLIGRVKRNISLIFRAETYEYENPGLLYGIVKDMLDAETDHEYDERENALPFKVRASNYDKFSL